MFFIHHKVREEKSMKRIKMLLVAILCVVMAFGTASVPASAEIIEVEKPVPPKEITVKEIKLDKPAYRIGESPILMVKFNNLNDVDTSKITSIYVRGDRGILFALEYNEDNGYFQGRINLHTKEEGRKWIVISEIKVKNNDGTILVAKKRLGIEFITNNNCADGNHTIYKDNWIENKTYSPCTESWDKTISCNICHQVVYRKIIPALGHDISEWILIDNPTFSYNGLEEKRCKRCGIVLQSRIIPKLTSTPKPKLTPTSKLKFKKKSITIKKGKSIRLKYTRKPVNAQDILSWKSSKPKVVKIFKNGKIKGLKKGKSVITLKTSTGKKTKITIKVK